VHRLRTDLLEHAAARAAVEGLPLRTEVADAQALTGTLFELFRDWFGPVATVIARVDPGRAAAFTRDWLAVADQHNAATDGTCEIPAAYLEVVAVKAA